MNFIYTSNLLLDDYINDSKTLNAVIRNVEIIGGASDRLPEGYKGNCPTIDWLGIRGFRNEMVDDYLKIGLCNFCKIENPFIPELITKLKALDAYSNFLLTW